MPNPSSQASPVPAPARGTRYLVPVDGRRACAGLIREAARMAEGQDAPWVAAYLDASRRMLYSRLEERRLAAHLRLVEQLGGDLFCILPMERSPARELMALAKAHGVTHLVLDKAGLARWLGRPQGTPLQGLNPGDPEPVIEVVEPSRSHPEPAPKPWSEPLNLRHLGLALLGVAAATGISFVVYHYLGLADVIMLFMLSITVTATQFGRWTTIIASAVAIMTLDFCFIEPRYTFVVTDLQHFGTFALMLGVGWVIHGLAERTRAQTRLAQERERHTRALYRVGKVLAEGGSPAAIQRRVEDHLRRVLKVPLALLLCDPKGELLEPAEPEPALLPADLALARQALELGVPVGQGTVTSPHSRWFMLPLASLEQKVGVLAVASAPKAAPLPPDRLSLMVPLASQVSLALERASIAEERTQARIRAEHEQLRATLLSSISHDLRTPLGSITGAASTLLDPGPESSPEDQKVLLGAIHHESRRLLRMVNNLLDITKLESGQVRVKREWVAIEEVVESALSHMEEQLGSRPISVVLPEFWIHLDPVLMELALINLLDNALKFSPPLTTIRIRGWIEDGEFRLTVEDEGPGIPAGEEELIFEKLYRGSGGAAAPGAGLGLAICRAIAQAHAGTITARTRPEGGARVTLALPLEATSDESLPPEMHPEMKDLPHER